MTKQRNSYSREFKLEAINMVTEHNRTILEVATDLGQWQFSSTYLMF